MSTLAEAVFKFRVVRGSDEVFNFFTFLAFSKFSILFFFRCSFSSLSSEFGIGDKLSLSTVTSCFTVAIARSSVVEIVPL